MNRSTQKQQVLLLLWHKRSMLLLSRQQHWLSIDVWSRSNVLKSNKIGWAVSVTKVHINWHACLLPMASILSSRSWLYSVTMCIQRLRHCNGRQTKTTIISVRKSVHAQIKNGKNSITQKAPLSMNISGFVRFITQSVSFRPLDMDEQVMQT